MRERQQAAISFGSGPCRATLTVLAPAKLNLFLHVIGRRADGYHLIQSLVVFASIGDRISVAPGDDLNLRIDGPFSKELAGKSNLVLKAANLLIRDLQLDHAGAQIRLEKNLPIAAGIGGGSGDAAAVLHALQVLWNAPLGSDKALKLALELGADVPACYLGQPVLVEGFGEILRPYEDVPEIPLLLVNPGPRVRTPDVFRKFHESASKYSAEIPVSDLRDSTDFWDLILHSRNDLEPIASSIIPSIEMCLDEISKTDGCRLARMSGSGATCFGLYMNNDSARAAAAVIKSKRPGWWTHSGHIRGSSGTEEHR